MERHIGILDDEWRVMSTEAALSSFMGRYMHSNSFSSQLWHFEYERETWGYHEGYVATLVVPGFYGRRFRGMWQTSKSEAESSACECFKWDGQVKTVRRRLPPLMKKIRNFVSLDKTQKDGLAAKGFEPTIVQKDMVKAIYNGLRKLGCRCAIWDGNRE